MATTLYLTDRMFYFGCIFLKINFINFVIKIVKINNNSLQHSNVIAAANIY